MGNKRILMILNNLNGGGAERVTVIIANSFVEEGYRVTMLLGKKEGVYFDLLDQRVLVHELNAVSFISYISRLTGYLRKEKYSHIFTASDYISAAAIIVKKALRLKAKVIATLHYNLATNLRNIPPAPRLVFRTLNKNIIAKADRIIAVSTGVRDGFLSVTGTQYAGKTEVIYNPAFDDRIYAKALEPAPTGIFRPGLKTIISVGRLDANKNHALLINAFALLTQSRSDLQLVIIGDGVLKASLSRMAKEKKLGDKVFFTGFLQNPFAFMAKSDLFVLPSLSEGLPTVLVEALALGLNVVSTDCPSGPAEILDNGNYGWLTVNNDVDSMANGISAALDHPKDAGLLRERAQTFHRKNVMTHYFTMVNGL